MIKEVLWWKRYCGLKGVELKPFQTSPRNQNDATTMIHVVIKRWFTIRNPVANLTSTLTLRRVLIPYVRNHDRIFNQSLMNLAQLDIKLDTATIINSVQQELIDVYICDRRHVSATLATKPALFPHGWKHRGSNTLFQDC